MAKRKPNTLSQGKYGDVETQLASIVIYSEYEQSKQNNAEDFSTYEALLDMIEGIRSEKNADWKSDINIPVVISHLLTEEAGWTSYFQTRDFVDVYLEGEAGDKVKTEAVKKLINKTLNMKDVYHFHKYMRTKVINWICGNATALCFWEQDIREVEVEQPPIAIPTLVWADGQPVREDVLQPQPPKKVEKIVTDRFNYEPLDPRNVFVSPEYCYSIQHKKYVIVRLTGQTIEKLKSNEKSHGYFNLDIVQDKLRGSAAMTTGENATFNQLGDKSKADKTPLKEFDQLDRYGAIPAIISERDEDGNPTKVAPGYDGMGEIKEGAEMVEGLLSFAMPGDYPVLIRFQATPFIDAMGRPYKPLVRSWCYIHPSKDSGLSDGKNLREIQVGVNDTFNISNDRVQMATLPTFVGRKSALEDNPTVYMEPEHIIELEDPINDLRELQIRDNIGGAWTQINSLLTFASQTDSIFPGTMGGISGESGTTATEVAGADNRSNQRANLKALTFEYTFLTEFYWIINQMTWRFARPETALKLMGELAYGFDPNGDYTYVPLSQSLESEHNKLRKVGVYDQMTGRLAGLAKIFPQEIGKIIAAITGRQMVLMGSEYQDIAGLVDALSKAKPVQEGEGATQTADASATAPMSNQNNVEMSNIEQSARGMQ